MNTKTATQSILTKLFFSVLLIDGSCANAANASGNSCAEVLSRWSDSMVHSVDFFERTAWDPVSGSYASEIDLSGTRRSETRHLIALSRMVYGLTHTADLKPETLEKAQ